MPDRGDRSHALLARKGPQGEPFLPKCGELYRVDTTIYWSNDPASARPVVVLCVPPPEIKHGVIQFVTRTSKSVPGVAHPADRSLQLDRDGVFSDLGSAESHLWTPRNVARLGVLPDPYLTRVLERFS